MKLRCSKCFGDLTSTTYDSGIFVEECKSCRVDEKSVEEEAHEEGRGYELGVAHDVFKRMVRLAEATSKDAAMTSDEKISELVYIIDIEYAEITKKYEFFKKHVM